MRFEAASALLALLPLAAAHGAVTSYIIGKTTYPGYEGFSPASSPPTIERQWPDYNPITSVTSPSMTCNGGTSAALNATIAAGTNITAVWAQWTHQQGPVMVWMYACGGSFSSCTGKDKGWFKIDQMGMWGTVMNSNNWGTAIVYSTHQWSSKIPTNIKPGNYLIRHELLALHQANAPQFYPECAQLVVTGSGTASVPASLLYSIPAYATADDPGVNVDIYNHPSPNYTCPGGPVWTGWE